MALVPEPASFLSGVLTSTQLNVGVRDVLAFLLAKPAARLRQSTVQNVANASFVALTFQTEDLDDRDGHSTSVDTSRYTAVYPGWYLCACTVSFVANATGRRGGRWAVNGSALNGGEMVLPATAANNGDWPGRTELIYLSEGDYVEYQAYQESGAGLNTNVASTSPQPSLSVLWQRNA